VSLRRRLTVAGGGAVFVALAIASLVIYFAVRSNLHDQIDFSLIQSAQTFGLKVNAANEPSPPKAPGQKASGIKVPEVAVPGADAPVIGNDGSVHFQVIPNLRTSAKEGLSGFVPLANVDTQVARGLVPPYFRDVRYRGQAMRLYTMRLTSASDGLVRTARPLTEANATIARVRWLLLALTLGGALAAGLLGRLAANAVRSAAAMSLRVSRSTSTRCSRPSRSPNWLSSS
jgi:two-component system, OmpR family, sensor histidine kinase MprB